MIRAVICVLLGYLGSVVLVYAGQRYLQYFPQTESPGKPILYGVPEMKELRVKTADGLELLAWFAPPKDPQGKVIVFYHGNAGDVSGRADKARHFLDAGYGVYLCEYRGYGGNPGSISEEGLYNDARAALTWLKARGYKPAQWVIYGESIGSGPAVQMAYEFHPAGLIIESGFSSAGDVGASKYFWLPVRQMLKDKYDNISKIKSVRTNLLMLHGDQDPTVPYALGKKLFDAAAHPKLFVTIKGGQHNDLYDYHAANFILDWLEG